MVISREVTMRVSIQARAVEGAGKDSTEDLKEGRVERSQYDLRLYLRHHE